MLPLIALGTRATTPSSSPVTRLATAGDITLRVMGGDRSNIPGRGSAVGQRRAASATNPLCSHLAIACETAPRREIASQASPITPVLREEAGLLGVLLGRLGRAGEEEAAMQRALPDVELRLDLGPAQRAVQLHRA